MLRVLICLLLVGCAAAKTAQNAKVSLVGMGRAELYACAGVPDRSTKDGDLEIFTYAPNSGARHTKYCEATFVLRNGIVESLKYTGNTGGGFQRGMECEPIVRNCM